MHEREPLQDMPSVAETPATPEHIAEELARYAQKTTEQVPHSTTKTPIPIESASSHIQERTTNQSHAPFERKYCGVTIEFGRPEHEIAHKIGTHESISDKMLRILPNRWGLADVRRRRVERTFGDYGVTLRITTRGTLRVEDDGNTRLYRAIEAGVPPERIPVAIPGEPYLHTTLDVAMRMARKETSNPAFC